MPAKPLFLVPYPRSIEPTDSLIPVPRTATVTVAASAAFAEFHPVADRLTTDLADIARIAAAPDGYRIELKQTPGLPPEAYRLSATAAGATIASTTSAGAQHGAQTLLQLVALNGPAFPALTIADHPAFAVREVMLDLGRAPHTLDLLRRFIRIMARLKLNSLHLHLCDDQLNSLKIPGTPLGSENPYALSIDDLAGLVAYAARYHIDLVPELECWGHAGAILHHYPELYGAPGMWEGFSFGVGEELYTLLEKILDPVVAVLPKTCAVHLGLDEAKWACLPSVAAADQARYTPESLVGRLHDMLQASAKRHGKTATTRIWADHGGRPVPERIRDQVVVEPWMYMEAQAARIQENIDRYGGPGKPPFMLGAGMSSLHFGGHFGATREWCRRAEHCPNVRGVDICVWETNDLADRLVGVFTGADHAWTPETPRTWEEIHGSANADPLGERTRGLAGKALRQWQMAFADADPCAIRADMGWPVYRGFYIGGPLRGQPVAPTAPLKDPRHAETLGE